MALSQVTAIDRAQKYYIHAVYVGGGVVKGAAAAAVYRGVLLYDAERAISDGACV